MKRVGCYLLLSFALTWTLWAFSSSGVLTAEGISFTTRLFVGAGMFCPAVAAFITRLLFRKTQPFSLLLRPHFRGNAKTYLAAWFLPALLTLAGAAVYFLVFPKQFDPSMGYARELGAGALSAPMVAVQIVISVLLGGLINVLPAAGEEIGWRGLLYPALRKRFSPATTCLIGGVIWGLWHVPVTMRGHNYGLDYAGWPYLGIAAMCVFCISLGTLLFWLTEKSGSIWPAAIAHGAVNAVCGTPLLFLPTVQAGSRLLGPVISGVLAGLPMLGLAVVLCRMQVKQAKNVEKSKENHA